MFVLSVIVKLIDIFHFNWAMLLTKQEQSVNLLKRKPNLGLKIVVKINFYT